MNTECTTEKLFRGIWIPIQKNENPDWSDNQWQARRGLIDIFQTSGLFSRFVEGGRVGGLEEVGIAMAIHSHVCPDNNSEQQSYDKSEFISFSSCEDIAKKNFGHISDEMYPSGTPIQDSSHFLITLNIISKIKQEAEGVFKLKYVPSVITGDQTEVRELILFDLQAFYIANEFDKKFGDKYDLVQRDKEWLVWPMHPFSGKGGGRESRIWPSDTLLTIECFE